MQKQIDFEEDGEDMVAKKREKKKKTREEKSKDRKVVFVVLVLIMVITIGFWLKAYFEGRVNINKGRNIINEEGASSEQRRDDSDGLFFVKYNL